MADVLFFSHPLYHEQTRIILVVCLMCGLCAGVPAVIWAFLVLRYYHRKKHRISAFILLLLINDVLELCLNIYVLAKLLQEDRCKETTCRILTSLWFGVRVCGVFLQQMMVLETDLALRYILCFAHVFLPCSVIISAIGFMLFLLSIFSEAPPFQLFTLLPPLTVTVTVCAVTCGKSPIKTRRSNRTTKSEYVVLTCTVFTMILYLLFLIACYSQSSRNLWMTCLCLLSFKMITDARLCVMVCKCSALRN